MSHTPLTALERCYQGYSTFLDVMMGMAHRSSLHYQEFVRTFQGLKQGEIEEEFGSELPAVLPSFQRHTRLTMARYFNNATIRGALAPLPRIIEELVEIIQFRQWSQVPPLPLRYTTRLARGPTYPPALAPAPVFGFCPCPCPCPGSVCT
jgi:hypothetical protein